MANLFYIKELAEKRNISIRELAERVGVGENRIHVMCKTNSTKIDTLEKIAKVLNVSVSYFFDEEEVACDTIVGNNNQVNKHGSSHNTNCSVDAVVLKQQLAEKDERIAELKERIAELKERIEELKVK